MRSILGQGLAASILLTLTSLVTPTLAVSDRDAVLPPTFSPPQVFRHTNLLRTVDLSKSYIRTTLAAIVENVSEKPQDVYYLPVEKEVLGRVTNIDARDRKGSLGKFEVAPVQFNAESETQYLRVYFPKPIKPGATLTMEIKYALINSVTPDPATVAQNDKQYLTHSLPQYAPAAYPSKKQKTKIIFPTDDVPEYTKLNSEDPTKAGKSLTYGPYEDIAPGTTGKSLDLRWEFTFPLITAVKLERDLEVSHWGGNLATEERYWLWNKGAQFTGQFSRAKWAATAYYSPPTTAIRSLSFTIHPNPEGVYYTDEIGNITTSKFKSTSKEYLLDLRPRFPVFGNWNNSFTIGYNHDLGTFLHRAATGGKFILKVPFLEGPAEPMVIDEAVVRVILPEGASDVEVQTPIEVQKEVVLHKTYMDTVGRTAVVLTAKNVVDEQRQGYLYVSYNLSLAAQLRKPVVFFTGFLTVFTAAFFLGKLDLRIK